LLKWDILTVALKLHHYFVPPFHHFHGSVEIISDFVGRQYVDNIENQIHPQYAVFHLPALDWILVLKNFFPRHLTKNSCQLNQMATIL
jgi:hypothetical protein